MLDGVVIASVGSDVLVVDALAVRSEDDQWWFLSDVASKTRRKVVVTEGGGNGRRGSSPHSVNYCAILSVRGGVGSSVASDKCGCGRL